ncbi:MAG: alpha-isopropylmalate synthase regulatory domain-containing protein [Parcubacteria group bacterium]|jgi:2-isopropylmalate synthase
MEKKKIWLNDVALRESAQVDGGAITPADQDRYVRKLVKGGIDIIEIGFPGSAKGNPKRCREIVDVVRGTKTHHKPILSGLARAVEADIDAVKVAGCDMVHIYIPVSDELMLAQFDAEKYGDSPEGKRQWVIDTAVDMVRYARSIGFHHVQFSPEDAARAGKEFICKIVEAVITAGATSVNLPDTTGLRILNEFGDFIAYVFAHVSNIHKARIACHCHNDSDHSTTNALQGIIHGITEVQGTFYGLGERSGMTKFESVIMNMHTRQDIFGGYNIRFDPAIVVEIVHMIANCLGMPVPRHWVVVGDQNGICSSGTHQAIEEKAKQNGTTVSPYYSWDPKKYGHTGVKTVVTQFSGKEGIMTKLKELGFVVKKEQLAEIMVEIKRISEGRRGTSLSDREVVAVVTDVIKEVPCSIVIDRSTIVSGKGTIPTASVIASLHGKKVAAVRTGNGPVSAAFDAVVAIAKEFFPQLQEYTISQEYWRPVQVTKGDEALGDVYVQLKMTHDTIPGREHIHSGHAVHEDSNHATAQAIANAISWMVASIQ